MQYRPAAERLVACVWFPCLEVQAERWRHSELAEAPLVLVNASRQASVVACSPEARGAGVRAGMPLREVLALAPHAVVRVADLHFYERVFYRGVARMERVSPLVEPHPPDLAYVDLDGLLAETSSQGMGLFRSREALSAALERAVRLPWPVRIGIARGKFAAWAVARIRGEGPGVSLSPSGASGWLDETCRTEFFRPLPVRLLPVSDRMRDRLERFGIRTLGELERQPLSALLAQFGPEGRRAWLLARGQDDEPLRPRETPLEISESLQLEDPEATLAGILWAVEELLRRTLRRMELRGRGVRQVRLDAVLEDGRTWTRTTTFRHPGTQLEGLFRPLRYQLEREALPGAVEVLTLALTAFARSLGGQMALFPEPRKERDARLTEELRQLRTRLRKPPVFQIVEGEAWSRIPERRYRLINYDP